MITLAAPVSGTYGTVVPLAGTLGRYGSTTRIHGARVYLQRAPHGSTAWTSVTSTITSRSGYYKFVVTLGRPYDYRVNFAGAGIYLGTTSVVRYPIVLQKVVLGSVRTTDAKQGKISAAGVVTPAPAKGTTVWLQRWDAAAKVWRNLGSSVASGTSSSVAVPATAPAGSAMYRLAVATNNGYGAGVSNALSFTQAIQRGLFKKGLLARGGTQQGRFDLRSELWPDFEADTTITFLNGTAWGDVSAAGCSEWSLHVGNWGNAPIRIEVIRTDLVGEGAILASRELAAGGGTDNPTIGDLVAPVAGLSQARVLVSNLDPNGALAARTWIQAYALCTS